MGDASDSDTVVPPSWADDWLADTQSAVSTEGTSLTVNVMEMPADRLSKDVVYMGAMTFAGLALFSTVLSKLNNIDEKVPRGRRRAAKLAIGGAFGMVSISLGMAAIANNFNVGARS